MQRSSNLECLSTIIDQIILRFKALDENGFPGKLILSVEHISSEDLVLTLRFEEMQRGDNLMRLTALMVPLKPWKH